MRYFIGLEIDQHAVALLAQLRQVYQGHAPASRWTQNKDLHVTLGFLGEIDDDAAKQVAATVVEVCARSAPFKIGLDGLGVFPSVKQPRVLFAEVQDGSCVLPVPSQECRDLQLAIAEELKRLGLAKGLKMSDRHHVTVAKVVDGDDGKATPDPKLVEVLNYTRNFFTPPWEVKHVTLFQSEGGGSYTPVYRVKLGCDNDRAIVLEVGRVQQS